MRDAKKFLLYHKNWPKFDGEADITYGNAGFQFLKDFSIMFERFWSVYPAEQTGITEVQALEIIAPLMFKSSKGIKDSSEKDSLSTIKFDDAPAAQWYRAQKRIPRMDARHPERLNPQYMMSSYATFVRTFTAKFISRQFKTIVRNRIRHVYQKDYRTLQEFIIAFDSKLEDAQLLDIIPTHSELWEILVNILEPKHLRELLEKYHCTDYTSIRIAWDRLEETNALVGSAMHHQKQKKGESLNNIGNSEGSEGVNIDFGNLDLSSSDEEAEGCIRSTSGQDAIYEIDEYVAALKAHPKVAYNTFGENVKTAAKKNLPSIQDLECANPECKRKGHFIRDCPKLGGSGISKFGEKFGTAQGFRPNDDPAQRPQHYIDAIKKRSKQRRDRLQDIRSKRKGGKTATWARQRKMNFATDPEVTVHNLESSLKESTLDSLHNIMENNYSEGISPPGSDSE